nr:hypothetical protein [Tanacetum cinerariifolium]
MKRVTTIACSLKAEQDSGNINRTQFMATLNEPLPQGTGSGSGLMCQVTILGGVEAQTRFEAASKQSNDAPLSRGTACLPNDTIFVELARMSSTMASTIIYLANNRKFIFSKYIFDNMVKHLEGGVKFLMFPRFLQVFLDKQVKGVDKHKEIYVMSSHTKNIFANIRRQRQGFSGNVTPLFETMMVIAQEEVGKGLGLYIDSHHTPTDNQPSSSKPQKKIKPKRKQRQVAEVHSPSSKIPIEESVLTPSNDPLPNGEDSIQLNELMIFCTSLQQQVLDLEKAKIIQAKEIAKLKKSQEARKEEKVKTCMDEDIKEDIDQDAEIALIDEAQGRMHDAEMFGVDDLEVNEVSVDVKKKTVEKEVSNVDPVTTAGEVVTTASVEDSFAPTTTTTVDVDDELTLEKTLITIKVSKPKVMSTTITRPRAKGILFHEQVQEHKPIVSSSKDKGKAKMIAPEKPLKKKDQIALDEEGRNIKDIDQDAEIALIDEAQGRMHDAEMFRVDDLEATIDTDRQLTEQIQAQEREQLSIEERSKLLAELIKSRRKYFAAKRAEEIRNKPPTKAQQRSLMFTYIRNMERFKQKDFKGKSFDDIKKIFNKEQDKVADDDTAELKRCLEIVPKDDDDVAIKATPLFSKSPIIVDYKIYREGNKSYFKITRADGNSQNYLTFGTMFKNFNREDLEVLRSIVKERFKKTKPVDDMENLLFQTLKTMLEPHVKDVI